MATLAEIRENPEYLGNPVTDEDVQMFCAAVEALMAHGMSEGEAINEIWGDGDWVPRAVTFFVADQAARATGDAR